MKTILVATDFSPAAANALQYAVRMARFIDARIVLYHAYLTETFIPDLVLLEPVKNLQKEYETLLNKQVESFTDLDRSNIELRCEPGIPAEKIIAVTNEVNAIWIIVGMKKSGFMYRKVFGSIAFTLCRHSIIPLIIVPEDVQYNGVRTIALASDLTVEHSLNMLDPLIDFATELSSGLYVVNVGQKNVPAIDDKVEAALNIKWSLEKLHPTFEFIQDDNVGEALNNFISSKQVDILALVAHEHSVFEKLFVKSTIKNMMFSATVPLMILPDKPKIELIQESVPGTIQVLFFQ